MANMKILDSGYLTATSVSGNQATQVKDGNPIDLKVVSESWAGGTSVDDAPDINTNTKPVVNRGAVNANQIKIGFVLNRSNSDDISNMSLLRSLRKTYGVKLLYYSDVNDPFDDISVGLGDTNKADVHSSKFFNGAEIPHLHVIVTGVSFTQTSKSNIIRGTLDMTETG